MSSRERRRMSFVERHSLWSDEQANAAEAVEKGIAEHKLEVVRFSFADQHGILRGKTVMAAEAPAMMRNGCTVTTTLLAKDTAHRTVFPVFTSGGGFGKPVPFSTRQLYRDQLARLAKAGFDYMAGLEVEFHLFRLENPRLAAADAAWPADPPDVSLISQGFQLLTETRYDLIDPIVEIFRRDLVALGLPLRSVELELGPSQG